MTFLNPLVLFAMAAASIPLLLHLFNLRKLRVIDFSSLKFLKELQKTSIKKLKLKRWLLLALRIGLVVFAVLAFARPALRSSFSLPGGHSKSTVVILVDNSGSMGVKDELGERLKRAKDFAYDVINSLENSDELFVLPMCNLELAKDMQPLQNRENMRSAVGSIKLTTATANLEEGLNVAASLLQNSKNINKEIFLVSDMQKANNHAKNMKIFTHDERLFVSMNSFTNSQIQNLGIDSIKVLSTVTENGKPMVVRAWVHNYGNSKQNVNVSMIIQNNNNQSERIAKQTVQIAESETQTVDLTGVAKFGGHIFGNIELEADPFKADNERYFALSMPDKISTAIVGSYENIKYLQLVTGIANKRLTADYFPESGFAGVDLNKYNSVVLSNAILNNSDIDRLKMFIENGGGVVIYAGENFANNTSALLKLGIKPALQVISGNGNSETEKIFFSNVQKNHQIFSGVFDEINSSRVEPPKFKKFLASENGNPIIKLNQGGNFLSEHSLGKGKIIYVACPASLEWSNFAGMNLFVPIAIRSVLYSCATKETYPTITTKESITLALGKKYSDLEKVKIVLPNKSDEVVLVKKYPSGNFVGFSNTNEAGFYKIIKPYSSAAADGIISAFVANQSNQESDLASMNQTESENYLSAMFEHRQNIKFISTNSENYLQEIKSQRTGLELWRYMLAVALLCAFAEMWVARK